MIHIGYNASARSLWGCALPNWRDNVVANAASEAQAIADAANFAYGFSLIPVLLSKGAGVADVSPHNPCFAQASQLVTYFLALLVPQYSWVDYSGHSAGAGYAPGASPDPALKLFSSNPVHWETDGVHISCDRSVYDYVQCVNISAANRPKLGSYRAAWTVLKAYKSFQ